MKRVILIVTDSFGVGELPDAARYGDAGTSTIGSIVRKDPNLYVPNLRNLGLFNIEGVREGFRARNIPPMYNTSAVPVPLGSYGRCVEASKGKDSTTGHWEIAGLVTEVPFNTYDHFPEEFIRAFEERTGRKVICNAKASGTAIIEELGPEQRKTGALICYTSADSVFQIAADTDVIPLEELYRDCEIAREMLVDDLAVARVIARPYEFYAENEGRGFAGGEYVRTSDRKDYSVNPPERTLLDFVKDGGHTVFAVGKINDLFNGTGITEGIHTTSNKDGMTQTTIAMMNTEEGLIFTNLVDFDTMYGHRRDPEGYGAALEDFDLRLPEIFQLMRDEDILIITADHGNDPSHTGWDHTREYTPLLVCGKNVRSGVELGTRETFADIAATIADYLEVEAPKHGVSFLGDILR